MERNNRIDYVEFAAADMEATKAFFGEVFGWTFTDYGPRPRVGQEVQRIVRCAR